MLKNNKYYGYIYMIINNKNNKIYIGQTQYSISDRFTQHKSMAKGKKSHKMPICSAIKKYGKDNFKIQQLIECICDTQKELLFQLNYYESMFIKKYNSTNPLIGYNVATGGSNSTSDNIKIKVCQYDTMSEKLIKTWDSISDAARCCNTTNFCISECCRGNMKIAGGYIWRYIDDEFDKYFYSQKNKNNFLLGKLNVIAFDINGNCIKKFNKEELIQLYRYKAIYEIIKVCEGQKNFYKKYIWRYEYDSFDKYPICQVLKKSSINKNINKDFSRLPRKVNCYSLEHIFIKTYNSINEAGKAVGLKNPYGITLCCQGKRKTAQKYIWEYAS